MKEKTNNFLLFLGALSIVLIPAFLSTDYKRTKKIEKLESAYYELEDKILEMSNYNDTVFKESKANDTYRFYYFDDFRGVLFDYEDILLELTQPDRND